MGQQNFKFHNLLTIKMEVKLDKKEHMILSGPMSPVSSGQEIASILNSEMIGLCRVFIDNAKSLQLKDENSYLDHLMVLCKGNIAVFFVDFGYQLKPVAYQTGSEGIQISEVYRNDTELIHIPDEEITDIFTELRKDMAVIKPMKEKT